VILVSGSTGALGGRILRLLQERGEAVRALVRPGTDAGAVDAAGVEVARGDLRDPDSLRRACGGATTVVSTATAIGRILGGEKTSIAAVDGRGTQCLIAAAVQAGAERFVYISYAGLDHAPGSPLDHAKRAGERSLREAPLRHVIVRPDPFQEVWLTPQTQLDWPNGKLTIFGRGEMPTRYVATDDVAALAAELTLDDDPPQVVEFGGPEPLTRNEVADLIERLAGRPMRRRHVPRAALKAGMRLVYRPRPAMSSLMGLGFMLDTVTPTWDDAPLRARGIEPRPASDFLQKEVAGDGNIVP
jgi:uncharacterized protein YbjT (DUF2867 family)